MKDLVEILSESKQDVPSWLESLGYESRYSSGGPRRPPNKKYVLIFKKFVVLCRNATFIIVWSVTEWR